ncbi:MAG: site-specific DNA-methyltransferase [Flavobacteriales bacterium]|nr:site-specific DNA-methyltransferase [Flavobacteriales bacterium]
MLVLSTSQGELYHMDSTKFAKEALKDGLRGSVDLILTSPPYPLNQKKKYGNLQGEAYKKWFTELAPLYKELLSPKGSIVMEIGNAWEPHRPVQSLLHLESLLGFVKAADLRLVQEFICYNPSKLPSPAQWVTVNRIRTVDSYTHIWWMAKDDFPKADNTKVLRPYSKSMQQLLKRGTYNAGGRPSEHHISTNGFLKDHGGSIAHNLLELEPLDNHRDPRLPHNVLSFSNTNSNDPFMRACRAKGITPHPARMHMGVADFFIQFLTAPSDLVFDPFAGSGTTLYAAEKAARRWIGCELSEEYIAQAKIRLKDPALKEAKKKAVKVKSTTKKKTRA